MVSGEWSVVSNTEPVRIGWTTRATVIDRTVIMEPTNLNLNLHLNLHLNLPPPGRLLKTNH